MFLASLILGILSAVSFYIPVLGIFIAIAALIVAIIAKVKAKDIKDQQQKGFATAGLVLSIIGISLSILVHLYLFIHIIFLIMTLSQRAPIMYW